MKTRISLRIRAVLYVSEFASSAFKPAKDTKPPNADIEDSNRTARMDRPLRVLVGRSLRRYIYVLLYDDTCQQ